MDRDRTKTCELISEMLDNPNEHGIYPTSTAYVKFEHYIQSVRAEAIGWAHADACVDLDHGKDPRLKDIPELLVRANIDLGV